MRLDFDAATLTQEWSLEGEGCDFNVAQERDQSVLHVRSDGSGQGGALTHTVAATPYLGAGVKLTGALRLEGVQGWCGLWLRVDAEDGSVLAFENMQNRVLRGTRDWHTYEIALPVQHSAHRIAFGALLISAGDLFVGPLTLDPADIVIQTPEAPRLLSDDGLKRLAAFADILGVIRFFHPAAPTNTDWDAIAIDGVRACETTDDIAATLRAVFTDIAPSVRFGDNKAELPAGSGDHVAWRHLGIGLAQTPGTSIYSSRRIALDDSPYGMLSHDLPAAGAHVTVTAKAAGHGVLWIGIASEDGQNVEPATAIAASPAWADVTLECAIPPGRRASLGLMADAGAHVRFADITLTIDGADATHLLTNPTFTDDAIGASPRGWTAQGTGAIWDAHVIHDDHAGRCVEVTHHAQDLPEVGEVWNVDLGNDLHATVPLTCPADAVPADRTDATQITRSSLDRATRLAAVIQAWTIFRHFYPYFDVIDTDWNAALESALRTAATDVTDTDFARTLRKLVEQLHDGHGSVTGPGHTYYGPSLPLAWSWIEDQLVITASAIPGLAPGDIVRTIDSVPTLDAITQRETLISGSPHWKRWNALAELLRHTSTVELAGDTFRTTVSSAPGPAPTEPRPPVVAELKPGVWYVDLDRATDDTFRQALPNLEAAHAIVFDLRGYPRNISTLPLAHLTDHPLTSARWHIPVVTRPNGTMRHTFSNWNVHPAQPRLRAKAAFITDARAISYAETYLGIVDHYQLAHIVGTPTAGTNGNVNPFALPTGHRITWTGMRVLKHDGTRLHGIGITPTIPVNRTIQGVREGRDELLEAAVRAVQP